MAFKLLLATILSNVVLLKLCASQKPCPYYDVEYDELPESKITAESIETVVNEHNRLRKLVKPLASNMRALVWSDELARIAQSLTDTCVFKHDKTRDCSGRYTGQNLFARSSSAAMKYETIDVSKPVQAWYNEVQWYDYYVNGPHTPGKVVGHYTQVVWANTDEIGCGMTICAGAMYSKAIIACNYRNGGNIRGQLPYKTGAPCSECPSGFKCKNDLCVGGGITNTKVNEINPRQGSIQGGTQITIKGEGFSLNQFNFGTGNENLGNKVKLVSDTTEYDCDIHHHGCTARQIVCTTRRMWPDAYYVRVYVDGKELPAKSHCNHDFAKGRLCSFESTIGKTPRIMEFTPVDGIPGTVVDIRGVLYTIRVGTNEAPGPNDIDAVIKRINNNKEICETIVEGTFDEYYGRLLDKNGKSVWGNMKCKLGGNYIGNHNITLLVDAAFGWADSSAALKVFGSNEIAMFQTYAQITDTSPKTSGQGDELIITSNAAYILPESEIAIQVGGADCTRVSRVDSTTLKCKIPEEPDEISYVGGRGWTCKVWDNKHNEDRDGFDFSTTADYTSWSSDARDQTLGMTYMLQQCLGYFIPAEDNDYRFYLDCSGEAYLYVWVDEAGDEVAKASLKYVYH